MYRMFIKYVTSRLRCLGLPVMANSPLNSMGIYTVFDRAPLPRIGDLPNGLHTDLKFQNQAQCCLFEPRGVKYDRAVGRESYMYIYLMYTRLRTCIIVYIELLRSLAEESRMAKSLLGLSHCFMLLACRFIPENSPLTHRYPVLVYARVSLTTRSRVNGCSSFSPHSFAVLRLTWLEQTALYSLILELQIGMQTVRKVPNT